MLSASETDRTTVEARLRAEVEQLLEDNLQLKRHKLEEASTCDGVVKLIKRYDRDRHATLDELNAGLAGIISRRTKLRRESRIRDEWEAEVVALQAQVHADGPRYKRLRNIKQKIAADLERDKQQVKLRQAPVDETTAPRPPHSVSVTPFSGRVVWQVVFFGRRQLRRVSLGSLVGVDGAAALFHPPLPARGLYAWETLPWRRLCERVS